MQAAPVSKSISRSTDVRRVLLITLALNFAVAVSKIVIGMWSGALAISADGFHSLMDGSANIVGLVALIVAERPPDDDHPYGHRRFETLAALMIGALLVITAWEIARGALERLQGGAQPEITLLTFVVMISTLLVNVVVSRYEAREGRRLNSELLIADAANSGADVFVTTAVLVSMVLVAAGFVLADVVAALIVVVLIGRAAWNILKQTGSVLVDTAPYPPEQLTAWAQELPSVEHVIRARSRGPSGAAHVDIDIQVAPETTADHAAAIADAIRDKLNQHIEGVAEVEVHFEPQHNCAPSPALMARAHADALGLTTHEVMVSAGPNGKVLEMHVEVPSGETLGAAHKRVSALESAVQSSLPDVAEVITHIEPAAPEPENNEVANDAAADLKRRARLLLGEHFPDVGWHRLWVVPHGHDGTFAITMHAALPAATSVEQAHDIAEMAEIALRADMPGLNRVTIHTEPDTESPDE